MTRVLLVDDHPMMRRGMQQLLDMQHDIEVIAEAGSGEAALGLLDELEFDLIMLDLNMKGMSGVETLARMRAEDVSACILILTVSDDHSDVIAAIRAGADGYVLKDAEPEQLIKAIRDAVSGQLVVSPQLTQALALALRDEQPDIANSIEKLTQREREILQLIARGYANKSIASSLTIAEGTVKVHVKNLLKKLQLRSRLEAAVWAVENEVV